MFSIQSKSILKSYAILVFLSTFIITGYLIHLHGHLDMFHFGDVHIESTSTTSTSTTDHHHAEKTFISEMKRRIQNIDTVCKNTRHEIKSETVYTSHLFWFPNHNIAYCPVLKAAHSTLMDYMIQVSNVTEKTLTMVKSKYHDPRDQILHLGAVHPTLNTWRRFVSNLPVPNNFTGVIIVRHPFERLVSAFRDKLERNNLPEPFYYDRFGKLIVQKYRKMAISALGTQYFNKDNNFGTPIPVTDNRRPNSDLPSFWEFAQSVIDGYKIDEHWVPINKYCSICSELTIRAFGNILKFEELDYEEKLFLIHSGWDRKIKMKYKLNVNDHHGLSGKDITKIYFSILSNEQILSLYRVYELDFRLFEYSFTIADLQLP